jgi:hypothetical protein
MPAGIGHQHLSPQADFEGCSGPRRADGVDVSRNQVRKMELEDLEREMTGRLNQHDERLSQIFKALHQLISPPPRPKRPVGFRVRDEDA